MQYPSRAVADLMRWASKHGCTYQGVAPSGHVKILLPNGEVHAAAATPSDRRAVENARRDISRKLGIHEKRPRSGRYKGTTKPSEHKPAEVRVDSVSARYALHAKRHRELCETITAAKSADYDHAAGVALAELVTVEAAIVKLGRRAPLRTFRV